MANISEINGYGIYAQTASLATTASYINPTFISASAAASGFGSGGSITVQNQGTSLGTATVFNFTGSGAASSLTLTTASIRVNSSYDLPILSITETLARLDNWDPTGWPGVEDKIKVINLNPNFTNNIQMLGGLSSGSVGKIITLHNSSSNNLLIIEHQSPSSSVGNRFLLQQESPYFLLPGREITFLYNGTDWSQFTTTHNFGGFDFIDDMLNGPQTATTSVITNLYQFIGSVGGTRADDAGSGEFGVLQLSTVTSATSNIIGAMGTRTGGSTFVSNNPTFPTLLISKVRVPITPSALQDFRVDLGFINSTTTSFTGPGVYWSLPTTASSTGFWQNVAVNNTNVLNTTTNSVIPDNVVNWLYLGIYVDGTSPNTNFIYFYSTDGVIYNISSKFTRTTSEFGGKPFIRIGKTVGTTARTLNIDWSGISFNRTR
jgi:hypothetical protein